MSRKQKLWHTTKRVAKAEALKFTLQTALIGLLAWAGVHIIVAYFTAKSVGYATFLYSLIRSGE